MTSDDFSTRYKLLNQIASGSVRSYTAEERASGRPVLVHFVDDAPPSAAGSILPRLDQLPPQDRPKILESARVGGATVVITPVLESFSTLENWLLARSGATSGDIQASGKGPPPAVDSRPAATSGSEPGEFTRLFGKPDSPPRTHTETREQAPFPDQFGPAASSGSEPGEFTRLFGKADSPPAAATAAREEGSRATQQEHTGSVPLRRLRVPIPAGPPPPIPRPELGSPVEAPSSPSEESSLRLGREAPPSIPRPELRSTVEAPAPSPGTAPLTLGWSVPRPEMPVREDAPFPAPAPTVLGPESLPAAAGPSDFTRIIGGAPTPATELSTAPVAEAAPTPEAPAPRKSVLLPLSLALNIILIVLIVLLLVL